MRGRKHLVFALEFGARLEVQVIFVFDRRGPLCRWHRAAGGGSRAVTQVMGVKKPAQIQAQ